MKKLKQSVNRIFWNENDFYTINNRIMRLPNLELKENLLNLKTHLRYWNAKGEMGTMKDNGGVT